MARLRTGIGAAFFVFFLLSVPPNFTGGTGEEGNSDGSASLPLWELHVMALKRSYGARIERVELRGEDLVFTVRGSEIFYREGRMLSEKSIGLTEEFDSIFYSYTKGPFQSIPPARPHLRWSHDFLDALVGSTEQEVRAACRWVFFLNHRVYVHALCADALERVNARIMESARTSQEVRNYIARIKVIYSMKRRFVRGTRNRSYHAYGLALDVIPSSYGGKNVYWQWSARIVKDWDKIPFDRRWHPPEEVIEAFEENGFVWGGKWYRFDTVHFEYRPEILALDGILYQ